VVGIPSKTISTVWHRTAFLLAVLVLALSGCGSMATRKDFYEPITAELLTNGPDTAAVMIEAARQKGRWGEKDRLMYFLDAGMVSHYAGDLEASNQKLHLAEQAAEELFTKSISKAAVSLLLNDNALEYSGEDYEILYANLIKALNYIRSDQFDDAFVEIRRANLKLDQLEQKYADAARELQTASPDDTARVDIDYQADKVRFNNDAFARYLSMHIYAADGKLDDARIDHDYLADAFRSQPHVYNFPMPDVMYYSDSGSILSVVALAGLAPVKEALNLRIRTDKDLDLVQVLYTDGANKGNEYGHLPLKVSEDYYFKFSLPTIMGRPSLVSSVKVRINGEYLGELRLIEDVSRVARETFSARKSLIYLRTIARAVVKGLAAHEMKKKADTGGLGGWLKKVAVDVSMDLTENADLRSTQFLPGLIYVGDFVVQPGVYDLQLEFLDQSGHPIGQSTINQYEVRPTGLNMVEGVCLQ